MLKKQKARKHLILQAFLISVYLKQRIDAEREGLAALIAWGGASNQ